MVSGSEIALFSLSTEECDECRESKNSADRTAVGLLETPQLLLATILIVNNLINVSFVTLSTFVTWEIVGKPDAASDASAQTPQGFIILILTLVVTVVILFFGELLPKVYATQYNLKFIRRTVFLIQFAFHVFRPLSQLLVSISNIVERRIQRKGYKIHIEELPEFIDEMPVDSQTSAKGKEMLKGIVSFGTITVKQIMTARLDITAFDIHTPFSELLRDIEQCGYSRIPIYRETIDKIEGILYVKDLLPFLDMTDDFKWNKLLRPRYFVPQNKKIDKLLRDFQEKHVHMALVVDEYGGTAGLITLEDIIEEIVGEIDDEFDINKEKLYTKVDDGTFLFEGKISLNDFSKVMKVDSSYFDEVKGESESLGGLMLEMFSRFPKANEHINYEQFLFTVALVNSKKIKVVKVQVEEEEAKSE